MQCTKFALRAAFRGLVTKFISPGIATKIAFEMVTRMCATENKTLTMIKNIEEIFSHLKNENISRPGKPNARASSSKLKEQKIHDV